MTSTSLPFTCSSFQLSPTPKSTRIRTTTPAFTHNPSPPSAIRMCASTQPKKIPGPKRINKKRGSSSSSEAEDLVRLLMRNFTDKQPLVNTLNKYVKLVRTEHCFLLFEELGKSDKWLQCLEVFRWMQKQRWYIADNGVYSKLISVMGKKGQTRMAMWLFSEMRNSGCKPDTSVYNALITAHLHSRDKSKALVKALWYFEKMKGMERCKPSIVTYNILLRAFAQARNVDQVNALFKNLDESIVTPDIYTFNGVMDAYGKLGMIREMELVLSRMKSNQIKPDIITFNLLIDAYGRKQEFDKMEQVFKSLLRSKEKPTLPTFNSMITNYGKARLREKADLMAESEKEKKVSTLNAMLDVYCRNALPMEADMLFESARRSRMFSVDSSTYKLLYKAYTKADMKEPIEKLLMYMDKDGIIPNKRFFLDALGAVGSSPSSKKSTRKSDGLRQEAATAQS
ncbi:Pentatricopeptide repeat-containing protein, chloroplastic [Sesamum angolense]|uniref:Pentatricopeptide repeat-containing protein, chloroplastic n=1 Tax=Sesamum angolense TaxID=2727404 RepID=A0AAE1VZY8_9LAMI|nr:Pentatricopeptide repeat-containing protein, chloroplastic [Sesamum angolense]